MPRNAKKIMSQAVSLIFISLAAAIFSTVFLLSLNYFFRLFTENLWLVFILPILGVLTLWAFHKLTLRCSTSHLHFEGITDYQAKTAENLGLGSALLVLISASLSQLFGASTGREGAAIQYGASLGNFTSQLQFKIFQLKDQDLIVRAGMVAGFSSLFGTPLAALVFLGERFGFKQATADSLKWAAVAYLSFYFAESFKAPHTQYPNWPDLSWNLGLVFSLLILFLLIFFAAVLYKKTMGLFFHIGFKYFRQDYLRIFIAGMMIAALTWTLGSAKYNGLGVSLTQQSFVTVCPWYDSILKSLFTLISVTSGFKGGEVTPLMAIGAALGSSLSAGLHLPLIVASAMGCIFFFVQVLEIPLTGAFLMMELFGASAAPIAFFCGIILWGFQKSNYHRWTL